MTTIAFWTAATGGLLLAVASVGAPTPIQTVGMALFATGILVFLLAATRRARSEDVGLVAALARGSKDALRFALYLMP